MQEIVTVLPWEGLDVSKETFDAALYLPLSQGELPRDILTLPRASFSRTLNGVKNFLTWTFPLREKAGLPGGRMRAVMESTGRYSSELAVWPAKEASFTHPAVRGCQGHS